MIQFWHLNLLIYEENELNFLKFYFNQICYQSTVISFLLFVFKVIGLEWFLVKHDHKTLGVNII